MADPKIVITAEGLLLGDVLLGSSALHPRILENREDMDLLANDIRRGLGVQAPVAYEDTPRHNAVPVLCWAHRGTAVFTTGRPEEMWGDSWSKTCDLPGPPYEWVPANPSLSSKPNPDKRGHPCDERFRLATLHFSGPCQSSWDQEGPSGQFEWRETLPRIPFSDFNAQKPKRPWVVFDDGHEFWRGKPIDEFVLELHDRGGQISWSNFEALLWAFPSSFLQTLLEAIEAVGDADSFDRMAVAPVSPVREDLTIALGRHLHP